jgi:hypothetical protein
MNLSPISAVMSTYNAPEAQSAKAQPASAAPIQDTVTLSPAAQKAGAPAGDVDHDGDSH